MNVIIFTDGSSRGNPGPGGFGAVLILKEEGRVLEIGGREDRTTNNRMELLSVINALKKAESLNIKEALVFLDSSYVRNGISKWVFSWQKNGWKKSDGGEVLNKDLWQSLLELSQKIKVLWREVPGHAGIPLNERVDEIATLCADKKDPSLFSGKLSAYKVSTEIPSNFLKAKKEKKQGGKAFSYVANVEGETRVFSNWNDCKNFVSGKKARFRKVFSREEEERVFSEFSQ